MKTVLDGTERGLWSSAKGLMHPCVFFPGPVLTIELPIEARIIYVQLEGTDADDGTFAALISGVF